MAQEVLDATLILNGKSIKVYKSKLRDTYIDFSDCKTEYKPNELNFKNR